MAVLFTACTFRRSRFQWAAEKGRALYHETTFHPLDFISLVTEHKLIGAIIVLAVLVFIFSVKNILAALRSEKEKQGGQD